MELSVKRTGKVIDDSVGYCGSNDCSCSPQSMHTGKYYTYESTH